MIDPTHRGSARGSRVPSLALLAVLCAALSACSDGASGRPSPSPPSDEHALEPPAPGEGIQLRITNADVPAAGEKEICQLFVLDNEEPLEIGGFEIRQPLGSHHFVVYSYEGRDAEMYPEGPFAAPGCNGVGPPDSMNLSQVAGVGDDYENVTYPNGTGIRLRPHHPILLNSHYVNSTGEPFSPTVYVNLYFAKQPIEKVIEAAAISNYNILVPPGKTATTTARWRVPFDMYVISLSSHEHKRGEKFTARIVEGEVDRPEGDRVGRSFGEHEPPEGSTPEPGDFYRSQDWEHPTVLTYDEPRFFREGTLLEFSCTQANEKRTPVTFGPLAEDEMCIVTGLYYRAPSAPPMGARIPGCLPQDAQLICSADPVSAGEVGPAVCGDGRKARGEACDRGDSNGSGGCTEACELDLPTGAPLGTRSFPIVYSGPGAGTTDFLNSIVSSSSLDSALGVVSDGPLLFTAGVPDEAGTVTVSQDAEVRIGMGLLAGSGSFCARILPTSDAGRVHCRGGVGANVRSTLDNASGQALATDVRVEVGQGDDSGPGAASLFLAASLVSIAGSPEECLTRDWSADAVSPIPFTTGNATGTITSANGRSGTSVVMSRDGENFDCSRWTEPGAPGVLLAMPFLAPNGAPGFGDLVAQLVLAGREAAGEDPGPDPAPSPTPVPTQIGGELLALRDQVFSVRCGQESCHSSSTRAGSLVLVGDDLYDQLVGEPAFNPAARAAGALRVRAGDPGASFLLRKLTGDLGPGEGGPMPFGGAALPAEEIDRIRAWVAAGAPAR